MNNQVLGCRSLFKYNNCSTSVQLGNSMYVLCVTTSLGTGCVTVSMLAFDGPSQRSAYTSNLPTCPFDKQAPKKLKLVSCLFRDGPSKRWARRFPPTSATRRGTRTASASSPTRRHPEWRRIYNPHLGLINAPPPYFCFSSKRPFSLLIYYQKGQKYTNFWPRPD